MEEKSIAQSQAALDEFDKIQKKIYNRGRAIVITIVVITIGGSFFNFNLLIFILRTVFSLSLFTGAPWVRYLFATFAGIAAFYYLWLLGFIRTASVPLVTIALFANMLYCIAVSVIMFTSKSVSEYFYVKRNG